MALPEQCRSPAGHGWRGPPSGRHTPQRRSSAIPAARRGPPILPRPAKNRRRLSIRRPAVRPVREAGQNGPSLRRTTRRTQMRFMVIVKATQASEAGEMPSEELLAAMGRYNEELVKAGVMLAGEGLQPSAKGARVRFSGNARTVIDGPFAETRELIAGFWMFQVASWKRPSSGSSDARTHSTANPRSRSARSSRPRTSARSSPGTARARGAPARRAGKTQLNRPALRQERGKRHANRPLPDLQR